MQRRGCERLFVGNLAGETTGIELTALFATIGTVKWADVAIDPRTNRCKGFGFVQMASPDATRRALVTLNGRAHRGRFITVATSLPKGAVSVARPTTIGLGVRGFGRRRHRV